MDYPSLPRRFLDAIDRFPTPRAQLHKVGDSWEEISSAEMLRRVAGMARALLDLGVAPGDRVALFAANRPEWHIVDFAALGIGAVTVPVYFNEAPERIVYVVNNSGARVAVVAGDEQSRKLLACRARLPAVEKIIAAAAPADLGADVLRYEALIANAGDADVAEYRRRAAAVQSSQLATIIYTSGTTGEPKGVMLTHANLSSNDMDSASPENGYLPSDVGLSFLPLSHVYERLIGYGYFFHGVPVAYVERPELVQSALIDVRPTIMACVPRVFEKIYATIQQKGSRATGRKKKLFDWAMRAARDAAPWRAYGKPVPFTVKLRWALADRFLFPKIRAALGGRLRGCFSGSAPLGVELLEFFWTVGVPIYQGYGLTETSPVVSTNWGHANRVGTVGPPIRNVEVRIAADGEILVRGPCVMQGYYNKPEATREALTPDGWLHTGDIGRLDAEGYLIITDRKKDLIKTAAGKFVAPQPIENCLKMSPYIASAVVIGDRRRFISALIVPNFESLEAKAHEPGITFSSHAELAAHPWVRELIAGEVARLTAHLAQYESIKRFALLDRDFTFEDGQVTYTMKVKRRVIEDLYKNVIETLYAESDEMRPVVK